MKKYLVVLMAFACLFSSCKEDEMTLTHKFSGSLSVTLRNEAGNAIEGITLKLSDDGSIIDENITNANGTVNFGSVNSGNYTILGENVPDGEYTYSFGKVIQIVAAETKAVTVIPSEYNANINIDLEERFSYSSLETPLISDVTVALVKGTNYDYMYGNTNANFESLMENVIAEQKADGSKVRFAFNNLPLGEYYLLVYTNNTNFKLVSNINLYEKNQTRNIRSVVESIEIREYRIDQGFYVQQRDASSYYNYFPFGGCTIYVLDYERYSNLNYEQRSNISVIRKIANAEGTTNNDGLVTINVRRFKNQAAICFSPSEQYIDYTSFSIDHYVYDDVINLTRY